MLFFASTLVRKQPVRIEGALLFLLEAVAALPAMHCQPKHIKAYAGQHLVNALRREPSQTAAALATLPGGEEVTAICMVTALAQAGHAKQPKS